MKSPGCPATSREDQPGALCGGSGTDGPDRTDSGVSGRARGRTAAVGRGPGHSTIVGPMTRSLLLLALASPAAAQTTWFVDSAAPGPGSGTPVDPFPSIAGALAAPAVLSGDTLSVAEGQYGAFDFNGKSVAVVASGAPELTIVSAANQRLITVANGEGPFTRLEGLTVRGASLADIGAGLLVDGASLLVRDCRFQENESFGPSGGRGGALAATGGSSVRVEDCLFRLNRANRGGSVTVEGGAQCVLDGCTIERSGFPGGGSQTGAVSGIGGTLTATDCTFQFNGAFRGSAVDFDAGDLVSDSAFLSNGTNDDASQGTVHGPGRVVSCLFRDNAADFGGALNNVAAAVGCRFENNLARSGGFGGAVFGVGSVEASVFENNLAHQGGAGSGSHYFRCVFIENRTYNDASGAAGRGGAILAGSATECRFLRNECLSSAAGVIPGEGGTAADATLSGCLVDGSIAGRSAVAANSSLDRCTVARAGFDAQSELFLDCALSNSIVQDSVGFAISATNSYSYCNVQGLSMGGGNFDLDPLFWSPTTGDLHLIPGSPCIDAGDPARQDPDGSRLDVGALPFDPLYAAEPVEVCAGKVTSLGEVPHLTSAAVPRLGQAWRADLTGALPGAIALGVWSDAPGATPFSGGLLCVGAPRRLALTSTDASGALALAFTPTPIQVGDRLRLQVVFRDPAAADGSGLGLSNGIEGVVLP